MNPGKHLLIHVERQGDVLILREEEDQKVVTGLTLLDGGIQADLIGKVDKVKDQLMLQVNLLLTSTEL